ncbi:flagellar protein FlaG, partial [Oleiphilus sp. HI0067]
MNDVKLVNTEFALRQGASEVTLPAKTTAGDSAPNRQADEIASELTDVAEQGAEQVEQAVANLNEYVQSVQRDLQFRLDDTSGKT